MLTMTKCFFFLPGGNRPGGRRPGGKRPGGNKPGNQGAAGPSAFGPSAGGNKPGTRPGKPGRPGRRGKICQEDQGWIMIEKDAINTTAVSYIFHFDVGLAVGMPG